MNYFHVMIQLFEFCMNKIQCRVKLCLGISNNNTKKCVYFSPRLYTILIRAL